MAKLGDIGRVLAVPVVGCLALVAVACSGGSGSGSPAGDDAGDGATGRDSGDPLEVDTDLGVVRGAESDVSGVRAFLTLPYAAPPSGENQWREPQPREPYDGPLDATAAGPACPQDTESGLAAVTPIPEADEDCLSLNVWSPTDAEDLPVMVWFPGGGFMSGSAHQPLYIGDDLAAEGVVMVGVNYRVGPFGFLATEELAGESDDGSYGNYGLADQAAALEWVQRNITAFGGDAGNVTVFGESAGGASVCGHLASPASEGLFHRAIVQSGGGCHGLQDGEEAKAAGAALLDAVGCDDMACLRELPSEDVLAAGFDPNLVADGVRLSDSGRERAERGELEDVEVLIGSNAEEETLFSLGVPEPTDDELPGLFAEVTDDPEALLALYPAEDYDDNLSRYRTMRTDMRFACPTVAFAEAARTDTYVYNFTYISSDDPFGFGPTHGAELVPLFAHPEGIVGLEAGPLPPADAEVSAAMQAAWVAFATGGDPGDEDVWRAYRDTGQVTLLEDPFRLVDEFRGGRCDAVRELTNAPW